MVRLENNPGGYPYPRSLIETLQKAANGGKRYRKLYNRARNALKPPQEQRRRKEKQERRAMERKLRAEAREKRMKMQGLWEALPHAATGRELTGATHTVSGGLPGTRRR